MSEYKVGEYIWTCYYFSIGGNLNAGYGSKSSAISNRIDRIDNESNGRVIYRLSNMDSCFKEQICNFGDPVYEI